MFHLLKAKSSEQIRNIIKEFESEYSLFVDIFYELKRRDDILIQHLKRSYDKGPLLFFEAKQKRSIITGWKKDHDLSFLNPFSDQQSCKFSYWDDESIIRTNIVIEWMQLKEILDKRI